MIDSLLVPRFNRLDEYAGVWCVEPNAFAALADVASRTNLAEHVAANLAAQQSDSEPVQPRSLTEMVPTRGGQQIAVVPVLGMLMKQRSSMGGTSTIQLRRDIRQAASNPDVSAILLTIDSPGGVSAGTDDLAAEVRAARRQKLVWAHIDDLGASAAYWVASQAGQIFANGNTALVGSIGTYQVVYDYSAQAEQTGVKTLLFATGPLKGAGVPGTPITDAQRSYFQGLVETMQREFDRAVKSGRGLSAQELADVRTGAVFGAQEAMQRKLIDGIRPLDRTIAALADAAGQRVKGPRSSAAPSTGGIK